MVNYFYDCYVILNKVYSDKTYLKQAINGTFIEESNRSLTIKTVYGVLDKDIELSYYISKLCDKSPKLVIRTIVKIAMYAIKYLGKKEYAVTKSAVELTKKLGKKGVSGFVNAILRKFISADIRLPKDDIKALSIKYSYPEFAISSLIKEYGRQKTESILSYHSTKGTLVFYDMDGEKYLSEMGVNYEKTPFHNVFMVENFVRNSDYDLGKYTFQSIGSVSICDLVEPCELLLDCCAAPGGKSIRLSYKCKSVLSFDIHEHRVGLINDYKARMRRDNVTALVQDSKVFNKELECSFDAVLCDAPCSGLGVVNDNPDIKLNRTYKDVECLKNEQTSILNNVSKYVKVGGHLYYSTCSILPEENIGTIDNFLAVNDNYKIVEIDSVLTHLNIKGANQFLPDISSGAGFFIAKLQRLK